MEQNSPIALSCSTSAACIDVAEKTITVDLFIGVSTYLCTCIYTSIIYRPTILHQQFQVSDLLENLGEKKSDFTVAQFFNHSIAVYGFE